MQTIERHWWSYKIIISIRRVTNLCVCKFTLLAKMTNNYELTITFANYGDYRTRLCSIVTNSPWSWLQSPHKCYIWYYILPSTEDNYKLTITFENYGDYHTRLCSIVTNSPWSWLQSPHKCFILFYNLYSCFLLTITTNWPYHFKTMVTIAQDCVVYSHQFTLIMVVISTQMLHFIMIFCFLLKITTNLR